MTSDLQSKIEHRLARHCIIMHRIVKQIPSIWPHIGWWHFGSKNGGYGSLSSDLLLAQHAIGSQHLQQVCALLRIEQPGQLAQQSFLVQACNTSFNLS